MHKRISLALLALVMSAIMSLPAQASDYLSMNIGYFDVFDDDTDATQFGMEYRAEAMRYNLRPIVGGFITDKGSLYGYAGLNWDLPVIENQLYIIPSFAFGAYTKGDDGKDLGGAIQFRSGIEIAYQFDNAHQVGIALNHVSNASVYDNNPGEESLLFTYSIPLNSIGHIIGGQ